MAAAWSAIRAHPYVTALLVVGTAVFAAVNTLAGMPAVVTVALPVAVGLVALALHRAFAPRRSAADRPRSARRAGLEALATVGIATLVVMVAIQAIPYGRSHSNPPITGEPQWASPEARELMVQACYSCHSNEVDYPPYAAVAPISWALQGHVEGGRDEVNYSEFATDPKDADETVEVIEEGEMPPPYYTRFGLNPHAILSTEERETLVAWLLDTPGLHKRGEDEERDEEGD